MLRLKEAKLSTLDDAVRVAKLALSKIVPPKAFQVTLKLLVPSAGPDRVLWVSFGGLVSVRGATLATMDFSTPVAGSKRLKLPSPIGSNGENIASTATPSAPESVSR